MTDALKQKNDFVLALRDHLMAHYDTNFHSTHGEGNFECEKKGGAYCLVKRDPAKPRDYTGFVFRKDLCFFAPEKESAILEDIRAFAQKKSIDDIFLDTECIKIVLGEEKYLITAYIEGGYAGDISVDITALPRLNLTSLSVQESS